jgi:hypothetical protein
VQFLVAAIVPAWEQKIPRPAGHPFLVVLVIMTTMRKLVLVRAAITRRPEVESVEDKARPGHNDRFGFAGAWHRTFTASELGHRK